MKKITNEQIDDFIKNHGKIGIVIDSRDGFDRFLTVEMEYNSKQYHHGFVLSNEHTGNYRGVAIEERINAIGVVLCKFIKQLTQ